MTGWRDLPKVELHCHLLGVISPALLRQIRGQGSDILVDPDVLASIYPVRGLDSFRRYVEILKPYQTAAPEMLRFVLAAHVNSLIAQRVVYTEIMLSPAIFPPEASAQISALQRWRDWAFEMEKEAIQIEFVMVVPRTIPHDMLESDTARFKALARRGLIKGVALVGPETGESIERFRRSFLECREAGLGIEVHAGEHGGPESVRDALENGFPDRLGHAVSAFQDPELIDEIRSRGIHLEFCPTSNVCTGAVASLQDHPIAAARELQLSYSINTDDPGAFHCSMEQEYHTVTQAFELSREDLMNVYLHSISARFEPHLRHLSTAPTH